MRGIEESNPFVDSMARDERTSRRRGPPSSTRERSPPSESPDEDDSEWYDDVVDDSQESDGGFSSFRVKRPQMHHADQSEGEQWERYFEKQYHSKADQKRSSIEDDWDESDATFSFTSFFSGHRILNLGIQSLMFALPLLLFSAVLVFAGNSTQQSMDNSTGNLINILLVICALSLTTIALIQIVVQSVNQSIHNRSLVVEGPDVPLLSWMGSFKLSIALFAEMLLTFCLVWFIELIGLYLLAGGVPELAIPSIDSDNISAGSILYLLGAAGSIIAMVGVLPYTIQATIERAD